MVYDKFSCHEISFDVFLWCYENWATLKHKIKEIENSDKIKEKHQLNNRNTRMSSLSQFKFSFGWLYF